MDHVLAVQVHDAPRDVEQRVDDAAEPHRRVGGVDLGVQRAALHVLGGQVQRLPRAVHHHADELQHVRVPRAAHELALARELGAHGGAERGVERAAHAR